MNKCQFCGTTNETVKREEDGLELCQECSSIRESKEETMKKEDLKVVEAEVEEEIKETPDQSNATEESDTKCEITLGMKKDGGLYFNAAGEDPNLLTIEGLLEFGKRRLKSIWQERDAEIARQQQEQAQKEQ